MQNRDKVEFLNRASVNYGKSLCSLVCIKLKSLKKQRKKGIQKTYMAEKIMAEKLSNMVKNMKQNSQ